MTISSHEPGTDDLDAGDLDAADAPASRPTWVRPPADPREQFGDWIAIA
ncbi:hypothetical protein ACIBG8_14765 [Nonomuraea sp. NPDC050556]